MKFYLPKVENENNIINFDEFERRSELITKMMLAGWLTDGEIYEYVKGAIAEAREYKDTGKIYWTVGDIYGMPSDTYRHYALYPTENIMVFMVKAYFLHPEYMTELDGFADTLKGAIKSMADRSLSKELLDYFESIGLYQFLYYNEGLCPEMMEHLDNNRRPNDESERK